MPGIAFSGPTYVLATVALVAVYRSVARFNARRWP